MRVFFLLFLVWLMCCNLGTKAFIIPDELPSLLSVIYSNIPTIKKGTDSRIGWGFRLGDRADFQVLVELGPQTNTQPLANQQQESNGNSKRNALENLANILYAQRQQQKNHPESLKQQKEQKKPTAETDVKAAEWLQKWSHSMTNTKKEQQQSPELALSKAKPGLGIGEIDAKSVIPDDSEQEEQQEKRKILESVAASATATATTASPVAKSTTSKEDALDNVDLD